MALAENQIDISKGLDSIGACVYVGTKEAVDLLTIQQAITNFLAESNQLESASRQSLSLVDGMGVSRVCQVLGC